MILIFVLYLERFLIGCERTTGKLITLERILKKRGVRKSEVKSQNRARLLVYYVCGQLRASATPILKIAFSFLSGYPKSKTISHVCSEFNWASRAFVVTQSCTTTTEFSKLRFYHWNWWCRVSVVFIKLILEIFSIANNALWVYEILFFLFSL